MKRTLAVLAVLMICGAGNVWAQTPDSTTSSTQPEPDPVVSVLRVGIIGINQNTVGRDVVDAKKNLALTSGLGTERTLGLFTFNPSKDMFVGSLGLESRLGLLQDNYFITLGAGALYSKVYPGKLSVEKYSGIGEYLSLGFVLGDVIVWGARWSPRLHYQDFSIQIQFKFKD